MRSSGNRGAAMEVAVATAVPVVFAHVSDLKHKSLSEQLTRFRES